MEKISFEAGKEEKFLEFINGISKEENVALISHIDLDGIASAKIVEEVVKVNLLKLVDYHDINEGFIEELKENKITKIIATDICFDNNSVLEKIEEFAEVLIIDHHVFSKDFNSEKVVFLNSRDYCGAYLAYNLFSKIKNLEKFDWLVACACITDWAYFNNQEFMKKVFEKYGDEFVIEDEIIGQSGKFFETMKILASILIYFEDDLKKAYEMINENIENVDELKKYAKEVEEEVEKFVEQFDKEKEIYGDIYFWEFNPKFNIRSIVCSLVSAKEYNKTFIFGKVIGENYTLSLRRQDKQVSMVDLVKKLISGLEEASWGGHVPAAGGHFLVKDFEKFKKRLEELD